MERLCASRYMCIKTWKNFELLPLCRLEDFNKSPGEAPSDARNESSYMLRGLEKTSSSSSIERPWAYEEHMKHDFYFLRV